MKRFFLLLFVLVVGCSVKLGSVNVTLDEQKINNKADNSDANDIAPETPISVSAIP